MCLIFQNIAFQTFWLQEYKNLSVGAQRWFTLLAHCPPHVSTPPVPHQKLKWFTESVKKDYGLESHEQLVLPEPAIWTTRVGVIFAFSPVEHAKGN